MSDQFPFNPNPAFVRSEKGFQLFLNARMPFAGVGLVDFKSGLGYSLGKHQLGFSFNYSGSSFHQTLSGQWRYGFRMESGSSLGVGLGFISIPAAGQHRKLLPALQVGSIIHIPGKWYLSAFGKQILPFRDKESGAFLLPLEFSLAVCKELRGHSSLYFQIDFSDQYPLNYQVGYRYRLKDKWTVGIELSTARKQFSCLLLAQLSDFNLAFQLQFQPELGWSPQIIGSWNP